MKWSEDVSALLIVLLIVLSVAGCTAVTHVSDNEKEVKLKELDYKFSQSSLEE